MAAIIFFRRENGTTSGHSSSLEEARDWCRKVTNDPDSKVVFIQVRLTNRKGVTVQTHQWQRGKGWRQKDTDKS